MSETKEVSINVSFNATQGTWMALVAAGVLLAVGVLAAVSLGVSWMTTENGGYGLGEIKGDGGSAEYGETADQFKIAFGADIGGVGLIATANVLAIIGTVFAFLAMAVLLVSVFVRRARLTLIGSIAASVATLLLMLTVVLAPIGITMFHKDIAEAVGVPATSLDWGAGLILGVIMVVLAIGASVTGFLSRRDGSLS